MSNYESAYEIAGAIIEAQFVGYDEAGVTSLPLPGSTKYLQVHDAIERECRGILDGLSHTQAVGADLGEAIHIADEENAHEAAAIMDGLRKGIV